MHEQPVSTLFLEEYRSLVDLENNVVHLEPTGIPESEDETTFRFTEMMEDDFYRWLQRVQRFSTDVAAGKLPEIGNGFRFVIDTDHPNGPISADAYTAYFSRGEVPLAAVGHREHEHDMGHGPNYQTIFGVAPFADCVRAAATSALNRGLCGTFTSGMDGLGDNMRNLEQGDYYESALRGARFHLEILVALEVTNPDPNVQAVKRVARFEELWQALRLPAYEQRVAAEMARRPAIGDLIRTATA